MSGEVVLVVLLGAALHAGWNAIVKAGRDRFLDTVLLLAGAAVLAAAALPFLPLPAPESWPFLAASVAIHVAYFALVAAAYRAGDMSIAYPLMRGTAPLIVAVLGGALLGERLGHGAWVGIMLICGGVLGIALAGRRAPVPTGNPAALALGNAVVIAAYTLVDGVGARLSGHAAAYTFWLLLLSAAPLLGWAAARRRLDLRGQFARRWHIGLAGGVCTLGSYSLALWAMTRAPIAPVAALRETSILFGMALSALFLNERFAWTRYFAAAAIAIGAMALKLA